MTDGTQLNQATAPFGDIVATDAITGGVANGHKVQRVKAGFGADGSYVDPSSGAGAADTGTARVVLANDQDPVTTRPNNAVSAGNSTTSLLLAAATFTGAWEDVTLYAQVSIITLSDVAAATDGVVLQWSADGVTVHHSQAHNAAAGATFTVQGMAEARYFRLVYTNGGANQATFVIQTIYKTHAQVGEIEQLDQPLNGDADAMLTRAVLAGRKPDTTYANVEITAGGNLKVSMEEVDTSALGLGKVEDTAHASGDVGLMPLAVRKDAVGTLSSTDGDYSPLQVDADGRLRAASKIVESVGIAAEGAALGSGVLLQGDDGADRKNVAVDSTSGNLQVDMASPLPGGLVPKYAIIDAAASGDNTLVAAVASKKIRVLAALLVSTGAVTTRFEDGPGGTARSGQMSLVANSGFTLPFNPAGWLETSVNTLLNLELSAAVSVDGMLVYTEV